MWGDRWGQPWGAGRPYEQELSASHRVAGVAQYELYIGESGSEPDFTAAPDATSATLPIQHTLVPPGAGTKEYKATCRYRNAYGIVSLNHYSRSFVIDAAGALVVPIPSSPANTALRHGDELTVVVTADYDYKDDGDWAADTWAVFWTDDGSAPDPAVDTPVTQAMIKYTANARLSLSLGPFAAGATVKVIVRCRRSADLAEDTNTTIVTHTVATLPSTPTYGLVFGGTVNEYR